MESSDTKNQHDISIALIQKDIEYIKQNMVSIGTTLAMMDKNYARHDDLINLKKELDTKLAISDFAPIKTTLARINWLIIATIVGGLISLVIKF